MVVESTTSHHGNAHSRNSQSAAHTMQPHYCGKAMSRGCKSRLTTPLLIEALPPFESRSREQISTMG